TPAELRLVQASLEAALAVPQFAVYSRFHSKSSGRRGVGRCGSSSNTAETPKDFEFFQDRSLPIRGGFAWLRTRIVPFEWIACPNPPDDPGPWRNRLPAVGDRVTVCGSTPVAPDMQTLTFGKFKGRTLDTIPGDYLAWLLLRCRCLPASLRPAVEAEAAYR